MFGECHIENINGLSNYSYNIELANGRGKSDRDWDEGRRRRIQILVGEKYLWYICRQNENQLNWRVEKRVYLIHVIALAS